METEIISYIKESQEVKTKIIENNVLEIKTITNIIIDCLKAGNKLLICGNGGSAGDSQHFAAEIIGRYKMERRSLPAIALTTDTSIITAIGNDYGYDQIFKKQVEGLANKGDILIGISTSSNSPNIIEAYKEAKKKGAICIGLLGNEGGKMKNYCDYNFIVPSNNTPRIQESHGMAIHIICEILEKEIFKEK